MRNHFLSFFFLLLSITLLGQIPSGYYNSATGTGYTLKTNLYNIIKGHTDKGYNWTFFNANDRDYYYENDGKILDIYSENPTGADPYTFTASSDQCGNYSGEGDCYNREHTIPQSWFNEASPMKSDVHHLFASDGYVNGRRGNYPFGEVTNPSFTSENGSKLGPGRSGLGYTDTVFEPIDAFKGDIARAYFYMATRYQNVIANWENVSSTSDAALNGTSKQVYEDWVIDMLLTWHTNDPVSQKEIDRNNAAYLYQSNRNPFVDHPEYVNAIWGDGSVPTTPTITTTATSGGYNFGNVIAGQSSSSVNYKVTGTNLTGNITVTVSAPFQVSLNNTSWSTSVQVTEANAEANTNNTVYVRFTPTTASGQTSNSNIVHTASGATTVNVAVTGREATAPTIITTASGTGYTFGLVASGQSSASNNYKVAGSFLSTPVTVSVSAPFQVSLNNTTWSTSVQVTEANAEANTNNTVYVRFSPTVANGQTYNTNITHAATGAPTVNVAVSGKEGTAAAPFIALNTASFTNDFGQSNVNHISPASSYVVSASNLSSNLTITPPPHFQVSLEPTSGYGSSLVLTQTGGVVSATTIFVIFYPTASGDLSGNITHVSGTATEALAIQGFGAVVAGVKKGSSEIQIHPNPSDGWVTIEGADWSRTTLRIFDTRGYRLPVRFKEGRIDVSDFPDGMYYFTFSGEGQPVVRKVIIH